LHSAPLLDLLSGILPDIILAVECLLWSIPSFN